MGATLRQVHARSVALLSEGLAALRILPGLDAAAIARSPYRAFYPHCIGGQAAACPAGAGEQRMGKEALSGCVRRCLSSQLRVCSSCVCGAHMFWGGARLPAGLQL